VSTAGAIYAGVDAGGTRTVALVGTGSVVLGRGEAGAANPQVVGFEVAAAAIAQAIGGARQSAGLDARARLAGIVVGAAGCGRAADRTRLAELLAAHSDLAAGRVQVVTDAALLLPAAGRARGVALVAGTGAAALGVGPAGREVLVGGWGYLLGDEGSAFAVGRAALRAMLAAVDGLGPATRLGAVIAAHLGVSQPREVIRLVYQDAAPRTFIAGLAPLAAEVARTGDPAAQRIFVEAAAALARLARAAARRAGLAPGAPVVATGGLLAAGELVLEPLRQRLAAAGLDGPHLLAGEPALGALRLAAGALEGASPH